MTNVTQRDVNGSGIGGVARTPEKGKNRREMSAGRSHGPQLNSGGSTSSAELLTAIVEGGPNV